MPQKRETQFLSELGAAEAFSAGMSNFIISNMCSESSSESHQENKAEIPSLTDFKPLKVIALVDGFNLYHSLDWFENGLTAEDKRRYRKYKWLCLTTLVSKFVDAPKEELQLLHYFTTYPPDGPDLKQFRHKRYVMAQMSRGVKPVFGEFKERTILCPKCGREFKRLEEKQTDVNIATMLTDYARQRAYDKLILLTADSDQVPALKLARKLHPKGILASLTPIGRGSKEIYGVCDLNYTMTEDHLRTSQLPDVVEWKSQRICIAKPDEYK